MSAHRQKGDCLSPECGHDVGQTSFDADTHLGPPILPVCGNGVVELPHRQSSWSGFTPRYCSSLKTIENRAPLGLRSRHKLHTPHSPHRRSKSSSYVFLGLGLTGALRTDCVRRAPRNQIGARMGLGLTLFTPCQQPQMPAAADFLSIRPSAFCGRSIAGRVEDAHYRRGLQFQSRSPKPRKEKSSRAHCH